MPLPRDLTLPNLRQPKPEAHGTRNLTRAGHGRPKGAASKITRDLKAGIIEAAVNHGRDGNGEGGLVGYLEHLAADHKKCFAGLLQKLLPYQVNGDGLGNVAVTAIKVVSIPYGQHLGREEIERIETVEHEPMRESGQSVPAIDSSPFAPLRRR
ncbi:MULTISPECIES: hypothetical protein [Bradyrhizobium]|uniref:hypothetical protein n=1 Tax=Bradyrhizobium TaxID=374 RepID=UPI000231CB63|nr:hypothetical protein [Bradyrhizobium japonicum]MCS3533935.1 hypothetical protein [Bradyrhizobium japonicum]MCS3989971.1 hypothetical protein [Bradyrhizobium japonicum]MCS4015216.1 hypothetical protein [Bradyrhizobium japonicum]MCS4202310.1 hypothetical protein [Bradyrhizobium japonicum]MDH6174554.1 hypothetical protein [Bradyrhizobium japonicum]